MMNRLGSPLLASYNGVSLNDTTETTGVSIRPQEDSSGRTVAYSEYTFTFVTYFLPGQTDAEVLAVRQKLTEPGGRFQFAGRGFGQFVMGLSRFGPQDVVWGPKTREITFDIFGPNATRRMKWQFSVRTPNCPNAGGPLSGRVIEYNTTITHEPRKTGLTRVITGHLVIPNNRGGIDGRRALDSADEWRERVIPPMLPGFDREFDSFTLSEDRSRLDWSVRDIEFGLNIPPKFVIERPKVRHAVSPAAGGKGLAAWVGQISGTYRLAKTCPDPYWPVKHFFGVVVRDRVGASAAQMIGNPTADAKAAAIVPIHVGIEEPDIYGEVPTYNLSFSWTFATRLSGLLSRNPMWRPIPNDGGWSEWFVSLRNSVLDPYGTAKVRFRVADDRITDLCDPGRVLGGQVLPPTFQTRELRTFDYDLALDTLAEVLPDPRPEASYLYFENRIFAEIDGGLVPVRPLPTKPPTVKSPQLQGGSLGKLIGSAFNATASSAATLAKQLRAVPAAGGALAGGGRLDNQQKKKNDPQQRVHDKCYVWLVGKAARVAFPIPCPEITEVNGARVVPLPRTDRREGFTTWIGFNAGLWPVYHAKWARRYYFPDGIPPGALPTPPNSILDETEPG